MKSIAVIATIAIVFYSGYLYGRRTTNQEARILHLFMEQLERIEQMGTPVE